MHKFKITADWTIIPKLNTYLEIQYSGLSYDVNADKLKPHTVCNFNVDYQLLKYLTVYLQLINMFDQHYEEVRGYGMSPFAAYVGTKAEF